MAKIRQNKRGKNHRNRNRLTATITNGPSMAATQYTGPTLPSRSIDGRTQLELAYLKGFNQIISGAGGTIPLVYQASDPFTLPILGFSSYAALYKEYRVLAIDVEYEPVANGAVNNVLISGLPFMVASDHKAITTPTAYTDIQNQSDSVLHSNNVSWKHVARAISPDEMLFVSTTLAPAASWGINAFASGYAAVTTYAATLVTYTIQFAQRV